MKQKVVLGLSGGVDSAVAARLLLERGFEVHPLWLDNGLAAMDDAAAVAEQAGLKLTRYDMRAELEVQVCAPFTAAYLEGRTPNPCALCNPSVKFPALLRHAEAVGAAFVATGHYARTAVGADGRAQLLRGRPSNDQSYMLARLPQEIIQKVIFPLGDYEKQEIRALAEGFSLPVAQKPDSMEICFIPDDDYAAWMERRGETPPPGDFVSTMGEVLGRHKGVHHYTIGQRRGLGVSSGGRLFVSAIVPEKNQVVLSDGADLYTQVVTCRDLNWISTPGLEAPREAEVRLRHSKVATMALLTPEGEGLRIETHSPVRAPTPGQLAVFYDGDLVLGSGWIT